MKYYYWLIPSIILVILIVILAFQSYEPTSCGDGICQEGEIEETKTLCDIDCKDICIVAGDIEQDCSLGWDGTYLKLIEDGLIKADYLKETEEINFLHPTVQNIAHKLKKDTVKKTVKAIAEWTYFNINYNSDHKYYDCRYIKASEIIDRETGLCSTMSKVNIALLRANGIPAFPITGCWRFNQACNLFQTFYGRLRGKFAPIEADESGYYPTKGSLHNWIVVPIYRDNKYEEILIESTSGSLYEDSCINYKVYYENPPDSLTCGLPLVDENVKDCEEW